MQTTTLFALFCTIVIVSIGVNDGAPIAAKTETLVTQKPVILPGKTLIRPGSRTIWKRKLDPKSKKLFNDYKKIITKKLQAAHKVPATFKPKADKYSTQVVSGILYHYLVKLPSKQYAYVTIVDRQWKKAEYGQEEHVTVRPQLYALNDKNI